MARDVEEVALRRFNASSQIQPALVRGQTAFHSEVELPDLLIEGVDGFCGVAISYEIHHGYRLVPGPPVDSGGHDDTLRS